MKKKLKFLDSILKLCFSKYLSASEIQKSFEWFYRTITLRLIDKLKVLNRFRQKISKI